MSTNEDKFYVLAKALPKSQVNRVVAEHGGSAADWDSIPEKNEAALLAAMEKLKGAIATGQTRTGAAPQSIEDLDAEAIYARMNRKHSKTLRDAG